MPEQSLMTAWVDLKIDRTQFDRQLAQIKSELAALKTESLALNNSFKNLAPSTSNFTRELAKSAVQATILASAVKEIAKISSPTGTIPKMLGTGNIPKMLGTGNIPKMLLLKGANTDTFELGNRSGSSDIPFREGDIARRRALFYPSDYNSQVNFYRSKYESLKHLGSSGPEYNIPKWKNLRWSQLSQQLGSGFAGNPVDPVGGNEMFWKKVPYRFPATREFGSAVSADTRDMASRARDAMSREMAKHKSFKMSQTDGLVKLARSAAVVWAAKSGWDAGNFIMNKYAPNREYGGQAQNPADGLVKSWKQLRYEIEATQTKKLDEFSEGFDKAKNSLDAFLNDITRARSSAGELSNARTRLALGGLDTSTTRGSIAAIRERFGSEMTQTGESIVAAQDRIRQYEKSNIASQAAIDTFMAGLVGNTGKRTILPEEQKIIDERRKLIQDNLDNITYEQESVKAMMITRKAIALEEKTNIENMKRALSDRIKDKELERFASGRELNVKIRDAKLEMNKPLGYTGTYVGRGEEFNKFAQSVQNDYIKRKESIDKQISDLLVKDVENGGKIVNEIQTLNQQMRDYNMKNNLEVN